MVDFRRYTVSIDYDRRLYKQDIVGSMAHAKMLAKQGIISQEDSDKITQGLKSIELEITEETFPWDPTLEDLHMNIERRLHDLIGAAAGRLHTARSRNDQVALDLRLYTKTTIVDLVRGLRGVQSALVDLADKYSGVVMPGYTHVQRAQPVLFPPGLRWACPESAPRPPPPGAPAGGPGRRARPGWAEPGQAWP